MLLDKRDEWADVVEVRAAGDGVGLSVPLDDPCLAETRQMIVVEVHLEMFPVRGVRGELVGCAPVTVARSMRDECRHNAPSNWVDKDL